MISIEPIVTLPPPVSSVTPSVPLTTQDIAARIQAAADHFRAGKGQVLPGTNGLELYETEGFRFFGVRKDQQSMLDGKEVKAHILQQMGLNSQTPIVQVIGDSQRFSPAGSARVKAFLEKHLENQNQMVLWGYTGQGEPGDETYEVNQSVSNFLESRSRFGSALASVVDFHTVKAIRDWKRNVALNNRNFCLVYDKPGGEGARFGDDIIFSDIKLTDKALVAEGGVQSFCQIVNFLSSARRIEIEGISNLRGEANPATYNKNLGRYEDYFSAAGFFHQMQKEIQETFSSLSEVTSEFIEDFKNRYLKTYLLFNSAAADAATKPALFASGWKKFMEEKLWRKLDQCHFERFDHPPLGAKI